MTIVLLQHSLFFPYHTQRRSCLSYSIKHLIFFSLQCLRDAADGSASVQVELEEEVMEIYLLRNQDGSVDVGIVIEGNTVLSSLGDLSRACCYLLGLTYVLDL